MTNKTTQTSDPTEEEKIQKIQALRDTINSAEKTIQSAKAMLLQLEGKKKSGRRRKVDEEDGNVIYGTFDGQLMIGNDGKQYPVPPNYASKSKLVEGDMLKLTITQDGSFLYKQIGPVERKHLIGIATQDENGNYFIMVDGKPYKILLASITYFKVEPGDEVSIVAPRDTVSSWAAIENVVRKADETELSFSETQKISSKNSKEEKMTTDINKDNEENSSSNHQTTSLVSDSENKTETKQEEKQNSSPSDKGKVLTQEEIDEWTADIEKIKKEIETEQA